MNDKLRYCIITFRQRFNSGLGWTSELKYMIYLMTGLKIWGLPKELYVPAGLTFLGVLYMVGYIDEMRLRIVQAEAVRNMKIRNPITKEILDNTRIIKRALTKKKSRRN